MLEPKRGMSKKENNRNEKDEATSPFLHQNAAAPAAPLHPPHICD